MPYKLQGQSLRHLRQELEAVIWRYCEYLGIRADRDRLPIYAHPIPIWQGKEPRNSPDGQVLLVGDAAGLVNPFFGDGLLHGIRSGAIAAQALTDGRARQYSQRLHAEVARNFDTARWLAAGFYRFPHWCFRHIVSQPKSTQVAARLLAGDLAFSQTLERIPGYLWRRVLAQ
jgi:flavin-dependent dehydrogenase